MIKRTSGAILVTLFAGNVAHAQDEGAIQVGKFDIKPGLTTDVLHIDNVTYASEEADEIDSWVSVVSPKIDAYTEFNGHIIEMGYRLERGDYYSTDADDYTDHFAHLKGDFEINDRNRFKGVATYEAGHDERGRRYSNGFGNELTSVDTYNNSEVGAIYSYGALSAFGRIDLSVGYEDMDYDGDTELYLIRDRSTTKYGAEFVYRIVDGTNLLLDADRNEIRYDYDANPANPLDSIENRLLAGFSWDVNAVTQSYAKVGYKEKSFEAASRDDFSGLAWEVGMSWLPYSYSEFTVSTKQDTRETNTTGADYIRGTDYAISWEHSWVQRFSTTATMALMNDDYVGDVEDLREDDTKKLTLAADYEFRRWLTFGLYYSMNDRESNRSDIEFDRNVYGLTAKVTL
ncbi:outer membrane beta-barrel protein [Alteromonas sp. NFXS44]|uniref:outer membrane beta-barrel protein n=1 Tax=Alteromonas sp. NFXS44 TaxID=2818435 RepID=UPI0032DFE8C5